MWGVELDETYVYGRNTHISFALCLLPQQLVLSGYPIKGAKIQRFYFVINIQLRNTRSSWTC